MARTSVEHFDPERFRQLREEAGLTITELASRSRISRGTISQWEHRIATPSVEMLSIVMAVLDEPVASVINVLPTALDLKTQRVLAGCTRAEVAEALGLSASGWGDIERGTTALSIDRVPVLAELFGVDNMTIMQAAQLTINNRLNRS
ncbi:helix-turn-helix domain-containing protein [Corynebacterium mucifaciens]|uniref:Helix-turn-helix domain-containing protein n=1 Tax=Corynebacterium mucifaciens TaxID=57171 RepID=A0A7X6LTN4_9CORY|nr:helix-turn-helix domain-containing protein [Corynebacterium mucifaciens]